MALFNVNHIGSAAQNNGILILVIKNTHQARIEVGKALDGHRDTIVNIIQTVLRPNFEEKAYYQGFLMTIDELKKHFYEDNATSTADNNDGLTATGFMFLTILMVVVILAYCVYTAFRGGSSQGSNNYIIHSSYSRSDHSGISYGGGGFDGGGSSGGGGSSDGGGGGGGW